MFCPEVLVFQRGKLMIWLECSTDWVGRPVPWRERLNLLRYSIVYNPGPDRIVINDDGAAWTWLCNVTWPVRRVLFPPKWLRASRKR